MRRWPHANRRVAASLSVLAVRDAIIGKLLVPQSPPKNKHLIDFLVAHSATMGVPP